MKKTIIQLVIIAVSIFMITSVYAASPQVGKGSNELFGQINVTNTKVGDNSSTQASSVFGYGRFVTDQLQLGGSGVVGLQFPDQGDTSGNWGLDLFAKFHFMKKGQVFVPYLGIQGGYMSFESGGYSSSAASYGGMGGIKYFISENTAINAEVNYRRYDIDSSGSSMTVDQITGLIGFAYYF